MLRSANFARTTGRSDMRPLAHIGGYLRGHAKAQVAPRDRLPVGLRPRLAGLTATD